MENDQIELVQLNNTDLLYLQDKATVDVQISTAKAYPRNIMRAVQNAIAIVSMDKETASTCTYSVPRAGKAITGPSVHLAKIIAQCWGNMRIETRVIATDEKQVTSQGIAFDLESNLAIKVEVKRSIRQKSGKMSEDMIVVTGNAANAIALRNAIFSVVPKSVTEKIYKEALKTITGDISDETKLIKRRKQVVDALMQTYNITEIEILSAIGKAAIEHLNGDDLVVLIGIGTAIKDGDTTIDEAFRKKNTSASVVATKSDIEADRIALLIQDAENLEELAKYWEDAQKFNLIDLYEVKLETLKSMAA